VTEAGDRPAPASSWLDAVREGLRAFGIVAAVGVGASLAVWLLAGPAYGFGVALRIGVLYLGAFHHVPIRIEGAFDIGELTGGVLPNSDLPTQGSSFVEIGIALLSVTVLAGWLLFRAGRRLAGSNGGPVWACLLRGAAVAPPYAAAMLLVALLVTIAEPVALGRLVEGELRVSLAAAQAFVFPLVIAAIAGGSGGLWAWLASRPEGLPSAAAALAGGWRMLWVGLALSYAGLFVAGVVQPDEPVAALTPSTARYFEIVFERPAVGAAILGHHLAFAPNEAAWTLVPAAGGCDVVRGSDAVDLLCYRRFPELGGEAIELLDPGAPPPTSTFGSAPAGYLLFLLVPVSATVLGGRYAARRRAVAGRSGAAVGALAGVAFAVILGATALLAGVSLVYGATVGEQGGGGSLWIGPHVPTAMLAGLVWGVLGGALGGATAGVRSAAATR
jgi:hypothetical protein